MKKAVSVTTFNNTLFGTIRGAEIDGRPHFVGNDLAAALGYKKPANAVLIHVPEKHKRMMRLDDTDRSSLNQGQPLSKFAPHHMMVDEAGMYRLIFHSRLKTADDFVEWVTADVLPTLRKTGTYSTGARLMAPEVTALMDGKTDAEIVKALKQYENHVAGNAKRKATNAAKRAKQYWSDGEILVAIARAISTKLCGGRFGDGTLMMYDVIERQCSVPLHDRQMVWAKGYGAGVPSSEQRRMYTFIMPEEIPQVLAGLAGYCKENGLDISDIVSKRQPRLESVR